MPAFCASANSARSNLAALVETPTTSSSAVVSAVPSVAAMCRQSCHSNKNWTNTLRLISRRVCRLAIICSTGRSLCKCASKTTWRVRCNNARNVGLPDRSVRSTMVSTKKPINFSSSGRSRLAKEDPTVMSVCPVIRDSSILSTAMLIMKPVTDSCRQSASNPAFNEGDNLTVRVAPLSVWTGGCGRSVGSCSGVKFANFCRQ